MLVKLKEEQLKDKTKILMIQKNLSHFLPQLKMACILDMRIIKIIFLFIF
jgi:hypothetical protein